VHGCNLLASDSEDLFTVPGRTEHGTLTNNVEDCMVSPASILIPALIVRQQGYFSYVSTEMYTRLGGVLDFAC
jgi:hypothetical protein